MTGTYSDVEIFEGYRSHFLESIILLQVEIIYNCFILIDYIT